MKKKEEKAEACQIDEARKAKQKIYFISIRNERNATDILDALGTVSDMVSVGQLGAQLLAAELAVVAEAAGEMARLNMAADIGDGPVAHLATDAADTPAVLFDDKLVKGLQPSPTPVSGSQGACKQFKLHNCSIN